MREDAVPKAEQRYKSYTARIIDQIRRLDRSCMHSADARASNVWEEYQLQVQVEHSVFFDLYEDTIRRLIARTVSEIPPHVVIGMWLLTPEGRARSEDDRPAAFTILGEQVQDEIMRRVRNAAADAALPPGF